MQKNVQAIYRNQSQAYLFLPDDISIPSLWLPGFRGGKEENPRKQRGSNEENPGRMSQPSQVFAPFVTGFFSVRHRNQAIFGNKVPTVPGFALVRGRFPGRPSHFGKEPSRADIALSYVQLQERYQQKCKTLQL
jgi:hypothetical protein